MRIAQLAPLTESVPPKTYGGTELVVTLLTEELVKRGHEVTLFASGDSQTEGELVKCAPSALRLDGVPPHRWASYELTAILNLLDRQDEFDVIHNHMGYLPLPFLDRFRCPTVSTNHNGIASYVSEIYLAHRHLPYVAISDAYRRQNYGDDLNYVDRVYNGIDTNSFNIENGNGTTNGANKKGDYLLFVGRLSHAKGTAEAIEIAKTVGMPLIIAGKVDHADKEYFHTKVEHLLDKDGVEYIGEVDHPQKVKLYHGAKAVLCPINFDEPFGLVFAEAMAAGTPVVARDRGSAREVLSDGETAIIGTSVEELVRRFPELDNIASDACIERARSLFDVQRMTDDYEKVYKRLIDVFDQKKTRVTASTGKVR